MADSEEGRSAHVTPVMISHANTEGGVLPVCGGHSSLSTTVLTATEVSVPLFFSDKCLSTFLRFYSQPQCSSGKCNFSSFLQCSDVADSD